jgi:hypothetical protein
MIPDMIKRVRWLLARSLRRDDFSRAALSDQVTGANEFRFDAFISYSHAADGKLAAALQHGLHRFAKPLFKFKRWSINSRGPSDSDKKATRRVVSRGELRDRKAVIFRGVRVRAFHRAVGDGAAKLIGKGRILTSLVKRLKDMTLRHLASTAKAYGDQIISTRLWIGSSAQKTYAIAK